MCDNFSSYDTARFHDVDWKLSGANVRRPHLSRQPPGIALRRMSDFLTNGRKLPEACPTGPMGDLAALTRFYSALAYCPGVRVAPTVLRTDVGILSIWSEPQSGGGVTVRRESDGSSLFKAAAELIHCCKRTHAGDGIQAQIAAGSEVSPEPFVWLKITTPAHAAGRNSIINVSASSQQFMKMVELERRRLQPPMPPDAPFLPAADTQTTHASRASRGAQINR